VMSAYLLVVACCFSVLLWRGVLFAKAQPRGSKIDYGCRFNCSEINVTLMTNIKEHLRRRITPRNGSMSLQPQGMPVLLLKVNVVLPPDVVMKVSPT